MNKKPSESVIKAAFEKLSSEDPDQVQEAIDFFAASGQIGDMEMLFALYCSASEPSTRGKLFHLLASIGIKGASAKWIEILKRLVNPQHQQMLLNLLWNSKLDFGSELSYFVQLAAGGDYLMAMECLTILENLEGPFDEAHILESQIIVSKALQEAGLDSQKRYVLNEINTFICDQLNGSDADLFLD